MIVTAALIWYDEHPEDLAACIRGMASIADRVVAVDGAYARYPDARVTSPPEQVEAIADTAASVGLDCSVHIPDRLWAGQVEKRSFLLAEAAKGSDWIAIADADWIIHGDRDAARAEVAGYRSAIDVVSVSFYTPSSDTPPATGWHRGVSGTRTDMAHLFRPLPGLHVERFHWMYAAQKNGQPVWMWYGRTKADWPILPQHRLQAEYEVEHRTLLRDERQVLNSRAFCNDRVKVVALTGQEDDRPGLPPPVFDFVTVPY
jgi:hypothetical protein